MRSTIIRTCATAFAGLLLLTSTDALASNPHFVGKLSARCSGADLLVSFRVAGLGEGEIIRVDGDGDGSLRCVTPNPNDNEAVGQAADISASGDFGPASKNGNIRGTLRLGPDEECTGQGLQLEVTYTGVFLELGNGDTAFLDGEFTCRE